jgi:hypothetical protein
VVGSAKGILSGGDPALEINHPGGVCWGNHTGAPNVTPDIQPGDVVSIKVDGDNLGETTVADASVTEHATLGSDGVTVTVKGKIAAGVSQSQFEQRIVNPDLTDLIGRRDVRALPGPLTPSEKGGYESGVAFDGNGGFEATYVFDDTEAAKIAAGTQVERVLSWQVEDGDANRQGLTISEFGESGGPGMGGCPAGPADAAAPAASYAVTRSADGSTLGVKWTPAQAVPGAAAVTGRPSARARARRLPAPTSPSRRARSTPSRCARSPARR